MYHFPGMPLPLPLAQLVEQLSGLPGIGSKTAMRLSLNLLSKPEEEVKQLAGTLAGLHQAMGFCSRCGSFAEHQHASCVIK